MAAKRDPHLISYCYPPSPPQVSASPNWILYYRSSQVWTTHFPLPLFAFSLLPFSLSRSLFWLLCSILPRHVALDLYFSVSFLLSFPMLTLRTCFSPLLSCSVGLGDLCFSHLPAWLNPPVCVVEPNAVIRMITICPPTSLWCWISIHHQVFASVTPCPVYWSGLTDHICPITQL